MFYLFFGSQSFLYRTLLTIVYFSLGPAQDDLVEEQNERLAQELAGKVSRLKNVSYYIWMEKSSIQFPVYMQLAFEIEHETKDQNKFLSGMVDDFDSSHSLLGTSMGRVKNILTMGSSNRKTMCYIGFLIFAFFIFIYYTSSFFSRK